MSINKTFNSETGEFQNNKFCSKCGTQLSQDANFCHSCGTQFGKAGGNKESIYSNLATIKDVFEKTFIKRDSQCGEIKSEYIYNNYSLEYCEFNYDIILKYEYECKEHDINSGRKIKYHKINFYYACDLTKLRNWVDTRHWENSDFTIEAAHEKQIIQYSENSRGFADSSSLVKNKGGECVFIRVPLNNKNDATIVARNFKTIFDKLGL